VTRLAGLLLGLVLLLPSPAAAQRLPSEVLDVLEQECDARPGPMPNLAAFGDLLNAVAWRTRHLGIGVSRKTGGHRVPSPAGEIAEDVLCDMSTGHHWDVIGGAGVGLPLSCGAADSIGVMRDTSRPCVAPVQPAGVPGGLPQPPQQVTQGPAVPVVVPKAPDYSGQIADVLSQLAAIRSDIAVLRAEAGGIRGEAANAHESIYRLIAETVIAEHADDIKRRLDALAQQVATRPPAPAPRWPW
jgi:hypothetical protein